MGTGGLTVFRPLLKLGPFPRSSSAMARDFPAPLPHGPIEALTERVYAVRGGVRIKRVLRISRNMAIVRDNAELTLVNPVRLDADGEAALEELGAVKRILRLGAMHGQDDAYYKHRFGAEFWSQPGGAVYPGPSIDCPLTADSGLPIAGAELFCFVGIREPEAALLVHDGPGVLLTCDAIQHYADYSNHNLMARLVMPLLGFRRGAVLGPIWLKAMTPEGASLRGEFERLLELDFDMLLAAHGTWLSSGAKLGVKEAVARAFGVAQPARHGRPQGSPLAED